MKRGICIVALSLFVLTSAGCLSKTVKDHLHTKAEWAREKTKTVVNDNSDEIVLKILQRLDEKLIEKNIILSDELKAVLVAEAQRLAKEYAAQGVDAAFDELNKLIDEL